MNEAVINLHARTDAIQRAELVAAAKALGKSLTRFMLDAATEKAREVNRDAQREVNHDFQPDATVITVSAEDFDWLCDWLEQPDEPNEGLDRLMAVRAPWEK